MKYNNNTHNPQVIKEKGRTLLNKFDGIQRKLPEI